MVTDI